MLLVEQTSTCKFYSLVILSSHVTRMFGHSRQVLHPALGVLHDLHQSLRSWQQVRRAHVVWRRGGASSMCCRYLMRGARLSARSRTRLCPPSWLMYSGNFRLQFAWKAQGLVLVTYAGMLQGHCRRHADDDACRALPSGSNRHKSGLLDRPRRRLTRTKHARES
jgi:hypothetical protein